VELRAQVAEAHAEGHDRVGLAATALRGPAADLRHAQHPERRLDHAPDAHAGGRGVLGQEPLELCDLTRMGAPRAAQSFPRPHAYLLWRYGESLHVRK
jgi:hypothetical protein